MGDKGLRTGEGRSQSKAFVRRGGVARTVIRETRLLDLVQSLNETTTVMTLEAAQVGMVGAAYPQVNGEFVPFKGRGTLASCQSG